jgi:hypothetical protein
MLNHLKCVLKINLGNNFSFFCVEYEHYNVHPPVGICAVFIVVPCVLMFLMMGGSIPICRLLVQLCAIAVFVIIQLRLNNHPDVYSMPS